MRPDSSDRYVLLNQLADEFADRYRRGERPPLQEFCDRHPDLADEIREFLPALVEMEQAKECDRDGAEPPPAPPLSRLGDYHVLREIGRGGMGIVYEAEQISLGRQVALKVLTQRLIRDDRQRRRFEREAKAAAKLHHTNIVPVFGTGEQDGTPYYVMQCIRGQGLDAVIAELCHMTPGTEPPLAASDAREVSAADVARSLLTGDFPGERSEHFTAALAATAPASAPSLLESNPSSGTSFSATLSDPARPEGRKSRKLTYWQRVARVGVQVADALEYAHQQGILHRDVKPSNLLLDLSGTVWVTDFGLAKARDQENLTHTGDVLGTLRYMPPEAFDGRSDARGDVYSLGLTLYELAALRPAFDEKDRNRLVKQVTTGEAESLRQARPDVPRDLATVIEKATDREPGRRYQTAGELAADLERFLEDEPVRARRVTPAERFGRWCRRNPVVAGLVLAVGMTLVAGAGVSAYFAVRATNAAEEKDRLAGLERLARLDAEDKRQKAEELTALADRREKEARWHLYTARLFPMMEAWRERDFGRLEQLLKDSEPGPGQPDFRGWEWSYLRDQCRQASTMLPGSEKATGDADVCRKTGRVAAAMNDGTVAVWNPEGTRVEQSLPTQGGAPRRLAWNTDGTRLACLHTRNRVVVWDVAAGEVLRVLRDVGKINSVAWAPDGRRVATGGWEEDLIRVWDTDTGKLLKAIKTPTPWAGRPFDVYSLAWHPDGVRLASGHSWDLCAVWDTNTGEQQFQRPRATASTPLTAVAWSPDGKKLAVGHVPTMTVYDDAGNVLHSMRGDDFSTQDIRWSPDGKYFLTAGGGDHRVNMWDGADGKHVRSFRVHVAPPRNVGWSPDGGRILTVAPGSIRAMDPGRDSEPFSRIALQPNRVCDLAWSPDGRTLACATRNRVNLCDPTAAKTVRSLLYPPGNFWGVAWSPDGSRVAAVHYHSRAIVWDATTGKAERVLTLNTDPNGGDTGIAWSPDGKWLATANHDTKAADTTLWSTDTWRIVAPLARRPRDFRVAFSPDGRFVAAAGYRGITVFDMRARWPRTEAKVGSIPPDVAWSPDGKLLAASTNEGTVPIVRAVDGKTVFTLSGHKSGVTRARWSPDGRRIGTSSLDGTVKLWDAATGDNLVTLACDGGPVGSLAWSPDGRRLACCCYDGVLRIWGSPDTEGTPAGATHLESGVLAVARAAAKPLVPSDDEPPEEPGPASPATPEERLAEAIALAELGEVNSVNGHPEEAAKNLRRAVDQLDRLAAEQPAAPAAKSVRAHAARSLANLSLTTGNEADALTGFTALCEGDGTSDDWYHRAVLLLHLGKVEDYRRLCAAMVERFGDSKEANVARHLALVCKLAPDAGVDLNRVISLNWQIQYPGVVGHLLYRKGKYREAADLLEVELKGKRQPWDEVFLAMTYVRLGRVKEARDLFDKALPEVKRFPMRIHQLDFGILRREAEALLREAEKQPR